MSFSKKSVHEHTPEEVSETVVINKGGNRYKRVIKSRKCTSPKCDFIEAYDMVEAQG